MNVFKAAHNDGARAGTSAKLSDTVCEDMVGSLPSESGTAEPMVAKTCEDIQLHLQTAVHSNYVPKGLFSYKDLDIDQKNLAAVDAHTKYQLEASRQCNDEQSENILKGKPGCVNSNLCRLYQVQCTEDASDNNSPSTAWQRNDDRWAEQYSKSDVGDECAAADECKTGICWREESICVPKANGGAKLKDFCTEDNQCTTKHCNNRLCQEKKKNGEESTKPDQCESGSIAPGVVESSVGTRDYHSARGSTVCTRCTKKEVDECHKFSQSTTMTGAVSKRKKCQKELDVTKDSPAGCRVAEGTIGFTCTCV